jgi:uncharacterized OB-fold protein
MSQASAASQAEQFVYPPMPDPTDLTRPFWEGAAEHRLMIARCQRCGYYLHPPRPMCRRCQSEEVAPEQVSGNGILYTYTVTPTAFHPYWADKVPYVVAVVQLNEQPGLRLMTNIVDCPEESLRVGLPVEVAFKEAAPGLTLPVFRPGSAKR